MSIKNFKKRLIELYEDLENFLVQDIDANTEIQDDIALERYMMSVYPNEYSTYCFIRNLLEKSDK